MPFVCRGRRADASRGRAEGVTAAGAIGAAGRPARRVSRTRARQAARRSGLRRARRTPRAADGTCVAAGAANTGGADAKSSASDGSDTIDGGGAAFFGLGTAAHSFEASDFFGAGSSTTTGAGSGSANNSGSGRSGMDDRRRRDGRALR